MAAQVPALFEALSGMPMSELLSKVRKIGDTAPRPRRVPAEREGDVPRRTCSSASGGRIVTTGVQPWQYWNASPRWSART